MKNLKNILIIAICLVVIFFSAWFVYQSQKPSIELNISSEQEENSDTNNLPQDESANVEKEPKVGWFNESDEFENFLLKNGDYAVAEVYNGKDTYTGLETTDSRIAIYDSAGKFKKEVYRNSGQMQYFKLYKKADGGFYFYLAPDGLGGYYAMPLKYMIKLFYYDFEKDSVEEILIPEKLISETNFSIEDISYDGKIISMRNDDFVALYFRDTGKYVELNNYKDEGFVYAGNSKFILTNFLHYQTALNNPDNERVRTIEYNIAEKTYKILVEE